MDCPKCGRAMRWYVDGLIRPAASTRMCPSCGAKLELLNGNVGLVINSILLGGGLLGIWLGEIRYMWLWIGLLAIGCWLLLPVWAKLFGSLMIWSYRAEQEGKARWLAAESTASTIMMAAWVFYMVVTLVVPYSRIISEFDVNMDQAFKRMEEFTQIVKERIVSLRGMIELGAGIVSFWWCQTSITRRRLLSRQAAAGRVKQQGETGKHGGLKCI